MIQDSFFDEFFDAIDLPVLLLTSQLEPLQMNHSMMRLMGISIAQTQSSVELKPCFETQPPLMNLLKKGAQYLEKGNALFSSKTSFENLSGVLCHCDLQMKYLFLGRKEKTFLLQLKDRTNAENIETKLKDAVQDQIRNEHQLREALKALEVLNTELKEMQDQLIQAEKLQSVGRLAAGIAHEVKNPLAIILQGLEYLERQISTSNSEALEVLKDLNEAVRRADEVIRSLLDYAMPQDPKMESGNMVEAIEKALDLMGPLFKKKEISVQMEIGENLPKIHFDSHRMHQVFVNLFSNALHAMDKKGKLLIRGIKLNGDARGHHIRIEIQDNGKGVPDEVLSRIFDPFVTSRRHEGGTGLGMSVVKGIIEMHQGFIKIRNHSDGGARVTIDL